MGKGDEILDMASCNNGSEVSEKSKEVAKLFRYSFFQYSGALLSRCFYCTVYFK